MRVIAGTARRLTLSAPKGDTTRPTGDKIKETLFNILAPDLAGIDFLDLFAGSGGIGIEALSRGAKSCTFIEKNKEAVSCIKKNLETTHFTESARVLATDVLTSLHTLHPKKAYGIVFMDPPYGQDIERRVLEILSGSDITDYDTMIIVETDADTDLSYVTDLSFDIYRIKQYKNSKHVFMRRQTEKGVKEEQ